MITILAVGADAFAIAEAAAPDPAVEVLVSRDAEEALEKLARNRRIDAVLITEAVDIAGLAREIREEDPGAPPLYAPASSGSAPGVRALAAGSPEELLGALLRALSGET